jgi:uncharacterized repeat protein (TIGR01451 family)
MASSRSRRSQYRSRRLQLEVLEERTLLSLSSTVWTPIGPAPIEGGQTGNLPAPVSGRITGLAADPSNADVLYIAAASGGVWKTTNATSANVTWTPLTDNQATLFMGAIALAPSNPSVIYAGTGEANQGYDSYFGKGILKSTDGGNTWTLLGQSIFGQNAISAIVVSPTDPNTVYVAVDGAEVNGLANGNVGVWKSSDGGTTWTNTTSGISGVDTNFDDFSTLVINPSNPQTLYTALWSPYGTESTAEGVYKTANGGTSWQKMTGLPSGSSVGRTAVAISPSSPLNVYVLMATPAGSLFRMEKTTNGGTSWTDLTSGTPNPFASSNQGWYDITLTVDPSNASIVYAGGAAGNNSLIESTNSGTSWSDLSGNSNFNLAPHPDHHAIGFDANGKLLDGDDGGLFRLDTPTPGNYSWSDLNGNLQITQFTGIALHPTDPSIAYGGSQDNGTEKYTGSSQWNLVQFGDGGFVRVDFSNPQTVYHTFFYGNYGFLERSDDGGNTWTAKVSGINTTDPGMFYVPYVMDPSNSSRLVLGTDHVYETTNKGDSWTEISTFTFPHSSGGISSIGLAPSDPKTIYVASDGEMWVTTNHGSSWTKIANPDPSPPVGLSFVDLTDIKVDPTNSSVAYVVASNPEDYTGGPRVWKTTNAGTSWTNITGTLPDTPVTSIVVDNRTGILYVGTDQGVYDSTDGGTTWNVYETGMPNVRVVDLELNPTLNILAAGTHGRGMWEILLPSISSTDLALGATGPSTATEGADITYSVTVTNNGPADATNAVVNDPLPAGTTFVSATFSQGSASVVNGTLVIDLGTVPNGSTVTGTIVLTSEEGSIANTLQVSADQSDPNSSNNSVTVNTTVSDPAAVATGGFTVSATEGLDSGSQTVATFTDPGGAESLADYSATIAWGDNNSSAGTITYNSGTAVFTVAGDHTYAEEGTYTITVTIQHDNAPNATATSSATVVDNPPTASVSGPTSGVTFQPLSYTFTANDPTPGEQAGPFTFTITWGDGNQQTLSQVPTPQTLSHTYTTTGTYTISVTATDPDGSTGPTSTQQVQIVQAELEGGDLDVGGNSVADTFVFTPGSNPGDETITLNGASLGTFHPTGTVRVWGGSSTNKVTIKGTAGTDTFAVTLGTITFNGLPFVGTSIAAWGVNGVSGSDTLDYSGYSKRVTVSLFQGNALLTGTTTLVNTFNNITTLVGNAGLVDVLTGTNATNTWDVTGTNSGTVGSINFQGFPNLNGGTAADTFRFHDGGSLTGQVNGGTGANSLDYSLTSSAVTVNLQLLQTTLTSGGTLVNKFTSIGSLVGDSAVAETLVGPNTNQTWSILGANSGTVAGASFQAFANLTGGTGNDGFQFADGASLSGTLNGGGGSNTADYSAYSSALTVNLTTAQTRVTSTAAIVTGGLVNLQTYTGSSGGSDTLAGPNATTTWAISGSNAGTAGSTNFSGFGNLLGGTKADTFRFTPTTGQLSGNLNAGGGGDTLDYTPYSTAVTVNLKTGQATAVAGTVSQIYIVRGSTGGGDLLTAGSGNTILIGTGPNDTLVGGNGWDILLGGGANDSLVAGSARDILIGSGGGATLQGGTADDILLAGVVTYYNPSTGAINLAALQALMKEWGRTDISYAARISDLQNGGGLNGSFVLNNTTLSVHSGATDQLFNGSKGSDWFLLSPGDQDNAAAGETVTTI